MSEELIKLDTFAPIKERFISLIDEQTFLKESSFAIQHLNKNSYLAKSTKESILSSVLNIAQVGLTLNPALKLAYLVPRRVGSDVTCCLEPSYVGLCKLATDTGSVKNIYAHLIYESDEFKQILGTENEIIHNPKLGNRGEFVGVYAVAILSDNRKQVEVMDKMDVFEIRDYSESYKAFLNKKTSDCVWERNFGEMARKTVVKRLCKYLPKTENWEKISKAIELDNQDYGISNGQINYIDSLLLTCSYAEEKKQFIERNLNTYTAEQATRLIEDLKNSQINPITHGGGGGSQTQIKEELEKYK